ncbi:MAG: hypothetical protein ACRD0Y_10825 [Terriglobales bacterium]
MSRKPSRGLPESEWNHAQREKGVNVNIEFFSTVAVITPDPPHSRKLYVDALGLPLQSEASNYQQSEQIGGCKSFGIWPLSQAGGHPPRRHPPIAEQINPDQRSAGQ